MIEYLIESPYDIKEELLPLNLSHYENDFRKDCESLNVNWDFYKALHDNGRLLLVTARDDGKLIGYMSSLITNHPHVQEMKVANMDAMFVDEGYRGNGIASSLLDISEGYAEDLGAKVFTVSFRDEEVADKVVGKFGYRKVECTFSKVLGDK